MPPKLSTGKAMSAIQLFGPAPPAVSKAPVATRMNPSAKAALRTEAIQEYNKATEKYDRATILNKEFLTLYTEAHQITNIDEDALRRLESILDRTSHIINEMKLKKIGYNNISKAIKNKQGAALDSEIRYRFDSKNTEFDELINNAVTNRATIKEKYKIAKDTKDAANAAAEEAAKAAANAAAEEAAKNSSKTNIKAAAKNAATNAAINATQKRNNNTAKASNNAAAKAVANAAAKAATNAAAAAATAAANGANKATIRANAKNAALEATNTVKLTTPKNNTRKANAQRNLNTKMG